MGDRYFTFKVKITPDKSIHGINAYVKYYSRLLKFSVFKMLYVLYV